MNKRCLYLSFSPREDSVSSGLANDFVRSWERANPDAEIIRHELGHKPVAGPDDTWIKANMTPEASRTPEQVKKLAASDSAIKDLQTASHIVLATPMFNFGVPWTLKAYIDNIVRAGKTFSFDPASGFGPLLDPSKKLLLIWASAGAYPAGTPGEAFDMLTPYVKHIFGFMGVSQVETVKAENMWGPPEAVQAALDYSRSTLVTTAAKW